MVNPDEDLPKPVRQLLVPPPLDMLGIAELRQYIAALEAEIIRADNAIGAKNAAKAAASAVFKMPPS